MAIATSSSSPFFFFLSSSPLPHRLVLSASTPAYFSVSCTSKHSSSLSSSSSSSKTLSKIKESGIIACLRAQSGEQAMEAAQAALRGGISVLEIVVSTPGVFEVIQGLVRDHPTAIIGAGTVLNSKDARNAIEAGARFFMSPATVKEILNDVQGDEVLYIPGVMTPTEVLYAYTAGAKIVKVYPVTALGGAQYISALRKPFSHIPIVASQGIKIESIGTYIAQGASAVVLSDAIFEKEAMRQSNFNVIYQLAHLATLHGIEAVKRKNGET